MNQPIRCEPLPFAPQGQKAAGEAALCCPAETEDFGEVLDARIQEENPDEKEKKKRPEDASIYAVAPSALQLLQELKTPGLPAMEASKAAESIDPTQLQPEPAAAAQDTSTLDLPETKAPREQISRFVPALQKVPPASQPGADAPEQIAGNTPKSAEKAHGIVVAQLPAMLLISPKQEEKAPGQELTLSLGLEPFESVSFEQPVRVILPKALRDVKSDEPLGAGLIESIDTNRPHFESVSEAVQVESADAVGKVELVESIRNEVQILARSGQDRMEVVIRPDEQTQLHLRIEKVNGQIQVQARCERGDFAYLEAHWSGIQQNLSIQGIRVEPLHANVSAGDLGHSSDREPRRQEQPEQNFIEQNIPRRKGARTQLASASAGRGWQSWA